MRRRWYVLEFIAIFALVIGVLTVLLYGVTAALKVDFFQTLLFKGPLLGYLIAGSLFIAVVSTVLTYALERRQVKALRARLSALATEHYEAPALADTERASALLGPVSAHEFELIRQKLIRLQQEIDRYSTAPVLVDGETKDEILASERKRLARELHDSVSQQLFAAMMMLAALKSQAEQSGSKDSLEPLAAIEKVINAAQAEMRALLLHLRPTELAGRSLRDGVIALLQELQTKIHIEIVWEIDDVKLPTAVEDNLFRIVQELLANTLRHAQANSLEVYLKQVQSTVVLRVVDDGVGFDQTLQEAPGSYGLANVEERAQAMGGVARIVSFKNQGTSIEVRVPLAKEI